MSFQPRRFGDQPMSLCIPTDRARAGRADKQNSSSFGGRSTASFTIWSSARCPCRVSLASVPERSMMSCKRQCSIKMRGALPVLVLNSSFPVFRLGRLRSMLVYQPANRLRLVPSAPSNASTLCAPPTRSAKPHAQVSRCGGIGRRQFRCCA